MNSVSGGPSGGSEAVNGRAVLYPANDALLRLGIGAQPAAIILQTDATATPSHLPNVNNNKMATSPDQAALLLGVQNRLSLNRLFGYHKGKPQVATSNSHHRRVVNCVGRGGHILIFSPIEQASDPHI